MKKKNNSKKLSLNTSSIKNFSLKELSSIKSEEELEQYYINNKIKNMLIDIKFIYWDIENINFLLSIFQNKKYKIFYNICISIFLDYNNWLKKDNNSIYARLSKKYLITDLEYIYNKILKDINSSENISENNINYINILEEYIKNDTLNITSGTNYDYIWCLSQAPDSSVSTFGTSPSEIRCSYDYNNYLSNNNFKYYIELGLLFLFILFMIFIKYIFSCITCNFLKAPINSWSSLQAHDSSASTNGRSPPGIHCTSSIPNKKKYDTSNYSEPIFNDFSCEKVLPISGIDFDIIFSKINNFIERNGEIQEIKEKQNNKESPETKEEKKEEINFEKIINKIPFLHNLLNSSLAKGFLENISI